MKKGLEALLKKEGDVAVVRGAGRILDPDIFDHCTLQQLDDVLFSVVGVDGSKLIFSWSLVSSVDVEGGRIDLSSVGLFHRLGGGRYALTF